MLALGVRALGAEGQVLHVQSEALVGNGWHPWYEVKADPENEKNLIVCGTKWDAEQNAALGFVYASWDGGKIWQAVLEDRNTSWVTEQSCAFGPNHTAYFISEASKVVDGVAHHMQGTTRLYVSTDGGQHWSETLKTGWADWSTSAVSSASGRLYTFFNSSNTIEPGRNWGSSVGLLVFSADGKSVAGPFFDPKMQDRDYRGVYPSYALALKNGAVVALYHAVAPGGQEADLGIIRAGPSPEPTLESTIISHTALEKSCLLLDKGSLAYDHEHDRLYVLYGDGCKNRRVMLTSSGDEGKTWTESVPVLDARDADRSIVDPSLVVAPGGLLALLWQEGRCSGRWRFSSIQDRKLVEPPLQLSSGTANLEMSNDSLSNWIAPAGAHHGWNLNAPSEPAITLALYGMLNNVWRGSGLIESGDELFAVWASGDRNGMQLHSAVLGPAGSTPNDGHSAPVSEQSENDVTQQTVILYAGKQHFDSATGTLQVCLAAGNRGDSAISIPIRLEAREVKSGIGTISVLNAVNGLSGAGAIWDISSSITGDRIPPRARSNPFCLAFHLEIPPGDTPPQEVADLLRLNVKVLASAARTPRQLAPSGEQPRATPTASRSLFACRSNHNATKKARVHGDSEERSCCK